MWERCEGGVTAARGYRAGAAAAGIRYRGRPDVMLLVSDVPAAAAGVFTSNRFAAAPVRLSREHLQGGRARAVVAVAGVANACTGARGMADARRMAELVAASVGCPPTEVLVCSTGVIGEPLPMDRVADGIARAAGDLRPDGGPDAAEAIRTTDTRRKESAVRVRIGGREVTVGGMAKGAGMIHPDMATMLAFLTTDARVAPEALRDALRYAVDRSFNCVSIDGDTSTNDTTLLLANGLAGNDEVTPGTGAYRAFAEALEVVCADLAKAIAADGEGAQRLIEVTVVGAVSDEDARRAARAVAASNLVKAAVHGADPNWGRVLSAVGASGARFDEEDVELFLGPLRLVSGGVGEPFDEEVARRLLRQDVVRMEIRLGRGWGRATAWGCDLSEEYVRINGSYRS
jgi:glutamate N-acetyltransferase/amino-acid N-acetyltransferase